MMPFSASTRPTKQNASPGPSPKGARSRRQAVVDDRPRDRGMGVRLVAADGDQAARRVLEQAVCPGQVQPPMERRDDGDRRRAREGQGPPLEVGVDDVEVGRAVEHLLDGRGEPAACVALDARRPQRPVHGRDEPGRDLGVAAREDGHVVATSDELGRQLVDDPLRPAVGSGRHALERRGDLRDAQAPRGRGHRGRCAAAGMVDHSAYGYGESHPDPRLPPRWRSVAPAYRASSRQNRPLRGRVRCNARLTVLQCRPGMPGRRA